MNVKSVLVVGGASGIGLEVARNFASRGVQTTIVDVDKKRVSEAQETLTTQGATAIGLVADVRDRQSIEKVFTDAATKHNGVDALIFTAGIMKPVLLQDMTDADFELTFDVNSKGFWRCVQAALPYFPSIGGSIVAISSASGKRPKAGNGAYSASKAALQFLVRTFAMELASRQIRVNCVSPSTIKTPLTERFSSRPTEGGYRPGGASPLGRLCVEGDIVKAVSFLCSEDASFITGATLAVDGGLTAGIPLPP